MCNFRAISNLSVSNGSDVLRINYLGDWGTQFGLLAAGYDLFRDDSKKSDANINRNGTRLRQYLDVYVKANERAEADPEFRRKAMEYFARLENGEDETAMQFWRRVVDDSIADLKILYSRLNVQFDAWESEYAAALPARALMQVSFLVLGVWEGGVGTFRFRYPWENIGGRRRAKSGIQTLTRLKSGANHFGFG